MAKEGLSGLLGGLAGKNPVGGIGMLSDFMGGGGGGDETNPGQKMFGMSENEQGIKGGTSFMDRFKSQMLMRLMGGMGNMGG